MLLQTVAVARLVFFWVEGVVQVNPSIETTGLRAVAFSSVVIVLFRSHRLRHSILQCKQFCAGDRQPAFDSTGDPGARPIILLLSQMSRSGPDRLRETRLSRLA